ncbi:Hsp70 family protein [Glycomyces sp. L485]|uniref:Hsp70 family protein n=1 Tax=Glycomyces sp. L485 TaxID=2909235 RepID=UPI001F4B527F|nr:Hsp70 family protein [Glycomyces sp. L485]MCH7232909.1 Hsp70 family protein [Glycomyces sp. L485]
MPADYLLSVDLGTSHTVAVVVWPDGRTRPLLFDGSPVMPSAVFLDEAGTIHVGRDAERLGPTAPERFEPNPKQRIGDGTMLLGDREIQVASAFSAILTRVARQCVEAIGGLPRTVLTCPAAWGEQRRAVLHDAAARAGYAPVQIVTEPVAAAHYYTNRLSHPIDPGRALAVFDFGGGTLDIAVVERRPDGSFGVLADGGLPDLGGLDFDAALVAHIGETVAQRDPDLWKRLEQPRSATELRNRRTLWNDVRGAKEMLSRSSVAPVAVPGMEQALHLTRGELDQLARPLLSRAVGETQRVVGLSGRRSEDLAGLFLVGGSSRMPLVAKVLHEQLGIAPTALEQPELPVSEGAAVAAAGSAPVTPPAAMSPPAVQSPATAAQPGSLPPRTPGLDATLPLQVSGGRKTRRNKVIALVAAIAVLAVAAPLAWFHFTDPYEQREFTELREVGEAVAYEGEVNNDVYAARVLGDKTLFAYTVDGVSAEGELHLRAVGNDTGEALWDGDRVFPGEGWSDTLYSSDEILAIRQEGEIAAGDREYTWHFLDWESGETLRTLTLPSSEAARVGDRLVSAWEGGNTVSVYGSEGEEERSWDLGDEEVTISDWGLVQPADDLVNPVPEANGDGRVWVLTSDDVVHVLDIESGRELASEAIETVDDWYLAHNGRMFVVVPGDNDYFINAYDIETLEQIDSERVRDADAKVEGLVVCGEDRVCVRETRGDDLSVYTYRVYDAAEEDVVHTFDRFRYDEVEAVGDRLLVEYYEGDNVRTQIFDKNFEEVGGNGADETFGGIDGGSALAYPARSTFGLRTGPVVGLGVRDGSRHLLQSEFSSYACAASDVHLACLVEEGTEIYTFREE